MAPGSWAGPSLRGKARLWNKVRAFVRLSWFGQGLCACRQVDVIKKAKSQHHKTIPQNDTLTIPKGKSAKVQAGLCLLVKEIRSVSKRAAEASKELSVLLSFLTTQNSSHFQQMLSDHE